MFNSTRNTLLATTLLLGSVGTVQAEVVYSLAAPIDFDGTSFVQEAYDPSHAIATPGHTLSATFTIDSNVSQDKWIRVIGRGGSIERNYGLLYRVDENMMLYQQYGLPDPNANPSDIRNTLRTPFTLTHVLPDFQLGGTYNLTSVVDADSVDLYINGVLATSAAHTIPTLHTDIQGITLGGVGVNPAPDYDQNAPGAVLYDFAHGIHTGTIHEATLWNTALSIESVGVVMDLTGDSYRDVNAPMALGALGFMLLGFRRRT